MTMRSIVGAFGWWLFLEHCRCGLPPPQPSPRKRERERASITAVASIKIEPVLTHQ